MPPQAQPPPQGWAALDAALLQRVLGLLPGCGAALPSARLACRGWKAAADGAVAALAPTLLQAKLLVSRFPALRVLDLTRCRNVRNRDLYVLAEAAPAVALSALIIDDNARKPWVTNMGLESIGRMASLARLGLHNCKSVTNNGLAELRGLTGLTSLSLRGCKKLSNAGAEVMRGFTALARLDLAGCCRVGDGGLAALAALPLEGLALSTARVTARGIAYLAALTRDLLCRLPRLESLDLSGNPALCRAELDAAAAAASGGEDRLRELLRRGVCARSAPRAPATAMPPSASAAAAAAAAALSVAGDAPAAPAATPAAPAGGGAYAA
ncbi:MAG: hypothetical protein J3K34DRAFT_423675 [Monoraphidium minutum]|nr:MAG: hypothetical protein J3K34DRAFT_423675 [Monoraphidium minutum]